MDDWCERGDIAGISSLGPSMSGRIQVHLSTQTTELQGICGAKYEGGSHGRYNCGYRASESDDREFHGSRARPGHSITVTPCQRPLPDSLVPWALVARTIQTLAVAYQNSIINTLPPTSHVIRFFILAPVHDVHKCRVHDFRENYWITSSTFWTAQLSSGTVVSFQAHGSHAPEGTFSPPSNFTPQSTFNRGKRYSLILPPHQHVIPNTWSFCALMPPRSRMEKREDGLQPFPTLHASASVWPIRCQPLISRHALSHSTDSRPG